VHFLSNPSLLAVLVGFGRIGFLIIGGMVRSLVQREIQGLRTRLFAKVGWLLPVRLKGALCESTPASVCHRPHMLNGIVTMDGS
jgi:hypothetical protein